MAKFVKFHTCCRFSFSSTLVYSVYAPDLIPRPRFYLHLERYYDNATYFKPIMTPGDMHCIGCVTWAPFQVPGKISTTQAVQRAFFVLRFDRATVHLSQNSTSRRYRVEIESPPRALQVVVNSTPADKLKRSNLSSGCGSFNFIFIHLALPRQPLPPRISAK